MTAYNYQKKKKKKYRMIELHRKEYLRLNYLHIRGKLEGLEHRYFFCLMRLGHEILFRPRERY